MGAPREFFGALGEFLKVPLLLRGSSWKLLGCSLEALGALRNSFGAIRCLLGRAHPGELLGAPRKLPGALGNSWGALGWSEGGDHEKQEKSQAKKRSNTLRTKAETRFRKTRNGEKEGVIGDFGGAPGRQFATVAIISFFGPEGHRRWYLAPTGCPWGLPAAP